MFDKHYLFFFGLNDTKTLEKCHDERVKAAGLQLLLFLFM